MRSLRFSNSTLLESDRDGEEDTSVGMASIKASRLRLEFTLTTLIDSKSLICSVLIFLLIDSSPRSPRTSTQPSASPFRVSRMDSPALAVPIAALLDSEFPA
jgi:hypothetical protein